MRELPLSFFSLVDAFITPSNSLVRSFTYLLICSFFQQTIIASSTYVEPHVLLINEKL